MAFYLVHFTFYKPTFAVHSSLYLQEKFLKMLKDLDTLD